MHSHDRTLLHRLGFADPDKGDGRHDLACVFFTQETNALKLAKAIIEKTESTDQDRYWERNGRWVERRQSQRRKRVTSLLRAATECPLSKGGGQYKTTIGFIDVGLEFATTGEEQWQERVTLRENRSVSPDLLNESEWRPWEQRQATWTSSSTLYVEVKIQPVPAGQIVRQVNLYREYCRGKFVVATAFPLQGYEVKQLCLANISHVMLGDSFEAFVAENSQKTGGQPSLVF